MCQENRISLFKFAAMTESTKNKTTTIREKLKALRCFFGFAGKLRARFLTFFLTCYGLMPKL